jgi:hypothetical protein
LISTFKREKIKFKDIQVGDLIYCEFKMNCDFDDKYKKNDIFKALNFCAKKTKERLEFLEDLIYSPVIYFGSLLSTHGKFYRLTTNSKGETK